MTGQGKGFKVQRATDCGKINIWGKLTVKFVSGFLW